ncbi:MAG: cytochrome P450 [Alphaproteobacteria bacterium]|nr:cytochrome P450 [Alphaproteobacteria bacterium]
MPTASRQRVDAMDEAARSAYAAGFDIKAIDRDFLDDPFPFYRLLRERDPVHRMPGGGIFLARWEDLQAVYRDARTYVSEKTAEFGPKFGVGTPLYRHHTTSLVFNDPPLHTRVRRLLAPAFTPRALALLQPRFEAMVDRLLDRAAAQGGMDVVTEYAAALPVEIIGDMLAIPHEERAPLRDWSLAILGALEPMLTPAQHASGNEAVAAFSDFLRRHIRRYRATPPAGFGQVLGLLLAEGSDGDRLSEEELVQNCIFLLNAGHETTTNLIGNGVGLLVAFPDEAERLRREPGLIDSAVEEFLRYESSNQLGNRRVAQATTLAGLALEPGTSITLGIGAANRDPAQFPDPDRLDLGRTPNRHLAFGAGIHACAGMTLARLEGRIAIGKLMQRFPRFAPAGPAKRGGRARFRGYLSYPVAFA